MYDRKKITLFVLLIATVLLGGVSLFLATQINQNQSPDDSQAGQGICNNIRLNSYYDCSKHDNTSKETCNGAKYPFNSGDCCEIDLSGTISICTRKGGNLPEYCGADLCDGVSTNNLCNNPIEYNQICNYIEPSQPTTCSVPGDPGTILNLDGAACNANTGNRRYKCVTGGSPAVPQNSCCNSYVWNGSSCVAPSTSGASCSVQGTTIPHGEEQCVNGRIYECGNGDHNDIGPCTSDPNPTVVSAGGSCVPNETVIDICAGSGICCSCSNGSRCLGAGFNSCATYCGGNVTTPDPDPVDPDPVTPPTQPGGSTGSTCTPTAPVKAKLTGPGNGAVINSNTVTLTWDRNGSWGVGCPENINQFRVRVAVVGVSDACPTDTSLGSYSRVGVVEGGPTGAFNLTIEDDKKYCWLIRKNNSDVSTDSGVRSFTVNIEEEEIDPGVDEDLTPGGEEIIDEEIVPITQASGGVLTGSGTALPDTAIVSDELDPILLGMLLVIIGLTLYKFDFGKKREVE